MAPLLVREGVRRDAFLATLGSRTWRPRAHSAAALSDLAAVADRAAYAGWLRRAAVAWSRFPQPGALGEGYWPLVTVGREILGGAQELLADLADLGAPAPGSREFGGVVDEAFLVGATHVAVVAAGDAAVLADAAQAFSTGPDGPLGIRFLTRCREVARQRTMVRRELSRWAADQDQDAIERALLAARALTVELAEALRA